MEIFRLLHIERLKPSVVATALNRLVKNDSEGGIGYFAWNSSRVVKRAKGPFVYARGAGCRGEACFYAGLG
jgi:hypothetical protein